MLSGEAATMSIDSEFRLYAPEHNELGDDTKQMLPSRSAYVVLVPGSAWKTKMWHWEGYHEVAKFMLKKGYDVVHAAEKLLKIK